MRSPTYLFQPLPGVLILLMLMVSCQQTTLPEPGTRATIMGADDRMGPCEGGGYFIIIDGHPNPNGLDGAYTTDQMPGYFKITSNAQFPIKVWVKFSIDSKCFGNYIRIQSIYFRKH